MLIYMNFLLKTFGKKLGPYILMFIHIALFSFILKSTIDNGIPGQTLLSVNTFDKFFPFLFASLFSIMVVVHVIKEGESNGVELMIVAKPITRKAIIISKFLVIFILLIIYQLITLLCYFSFAMYDTAASNLVRLKWAASFSLGGLIVQSIFIFVIIIIASTLGKMTTSVIALLAAAIIPIFSFMTIQVSKGYVRLNDATGGSQSFVQTFKWKKDDEGSPKNKTLSISKVYKYGLENSKYAKDRWDNYLSKRWYEYAFPLDLWYQWGRFYSLFIKERSSLIASEMSSTAFPLKGAVQKLSKEKAVQVKKEKDDLVLTIGKGDKKEEYHLYFRNNTRDLYLGKQIQSFFQKDKLKLFINLLVSKLKDEFEVRSSAKSVGAKTGWGEGKITIANFNKLNLSHRLNWIDIKLELLRSQYVPKDKLLSKWIKDNSKMFTRILKFTKSAIYVILSNELELDNPDDPDPKAPKLKIDNKNVKIPEPEIFSFEDNNFIRSDKDSLLGWEVTSKSYLDTTTVILVWIFIAIILGSISIAIFFKRDFK